MQATLYKWMDGKFYLKEPSMPGEPDKPWLHLSYFKTLYEMDLAMATDRASLMAGSILKTNPELIDTYIPMCSEGWCLHQMWLDNDNFQLVGKDG